jgi:hypothetical protein
MSDRLTGGSKRLHNEEIINFSRPMYACSLPFAYYDDQVKEDEMDRACDMDKGDEKCIDLQLSYWWKILKGRDYLEDLDRDGSSRRNGS